MNRNVSTSTRQPDRRATGQAGEGGQRALRKNRTDTLPDVSEYITRRLDMFVGWISDVT